MVEVLMSASVDASRSFGPYDGPLSDRFVSNVDPTYGSVFEIRVDTPELREFDRWLRKNPIFVRVPGEKYLLFGMKSWSRAPGEIMVVRANVLIARSDQPRGPWQPDGGQLLAWAFSVLDHYELDYDPERQGWTRSRQNLIDWYSRDSVPVDWKAVEARLRATGRPVPADLYDDHP